MATYDYKCTTCDNIQEEVHGMTETPAISCERCGGDARKYLTAAGCNITKYGDGKSMTHWEEVKYRK